MTDGTTAATGDTSTQVRLKFNEWPKNTQHP